MGSTEIFFVETSSADKRLVLCKWVEKFYEEGKKVQVLTDSSMGAQHLDQLLWTFSQGSFIPHRVVSNTSCSKSFEPVLITIGPLQLSNFDAVVADVIVELEILLHYRSAVHLVVLDDPDQRQASRLLWQKAKDEGILVKHLQYQGRN